MRQCNFKALVPDVALLAALFSLLHGPGRGQNSPLHLGDSNLSGQVLGALASGTYAPLA
jgi:hypothetical protein